MSLVLSARDLTAIRRRGEENYPHECCGFLLGHEREGKREVARLLDADNEREDSPRNRYLISPEAYLAAERAAEREGREVLGFYHSHPDAEARPSEFDRAHALPGVSYVIVSVRERRAGEVNSWVLREDRTRFEPEPIEG